MTTVEQDNTVDSDERASDEEFADELVEEEAEREATVASEKEAGPDHHSAASRLYRGETAFSFVNRRKLWFTLSLIIIIAGMASVGFRGLNLGIQFKGGTGWIVKSKSLTSSQAMSAAQAAGLSTPSVQILGTGNSRTVEVEGNLNKLSTAAKTKTQTAIQTALAKAAGVKVTTISRTSVGPTWGGDVTKRAVYALVLFFVIVAVYISVRFEGKMAIAAFVALCHDLLVTIGVYSIAGFQVTPDTVVAVLTILGYSLYDTVVVFDRVRDNTRGLGSTGRMTYSEMVDLSMNQTLARSINTSLVAILPVMAVLIVGAEILGATTLQDYGLALTVGLLSGAYSSIFIASPILAMLKEREQRYTTIRQRLETRGDRMGLISPTAAAALVGASQGTGQTVVQPRGRQGSARAAAVKPGSAPRQGAATSVPAATKPGGATTGPRKAQGPSRPAPRPRKGGGKSKGKRRR